MKLLIDERKTQAFFAPRKQLNENSVNVIQGAREYPKLAAELCSVTHVVLNLEAQRLHPGVIDSSLIVQGADKAKQHVAGKSLDEGPKWAGDPKRPLCEAVKSKA